MFIQIPNFLLNVDIFELISYKCFCSVKDFLISVCKRYILGRKFFCEHQNIYLFVVSKIKFINYNLGILTTLTSQPLYQMCRPRSIAIPVYALECLVDHSLYMNFMFMYTLSVDFSQLPFIICCTIPVYQRLPRYIYIMLYFQ